jgi:hypothetical protein
MLADAAQTGLARKHDAAVRREAETKAIRVQMARRRAFRLADTAEMKDLIAKPSLPLPLSLSEWQDEQRKDGRHN